jgi:hypothetical protein
VGPALRGRDRPEGLGTRLRSQPAGRPGWGSGRRAPPPPPPRALVSRPPTCQRKPGSSSARAVLRPAGRRAMAQPGPAIGAVVMRQAAGGVMLALRRVRALGRTRAARRRSGFPRDRRTGPARAGRVPRFLAIVGRVLTHWITPDTGRGKGNTRRAGRAGRPGHQQSPPAWTVRS